MSLHKEGVSLENFTTNSKKLALPFFYFTDADGHKSASSQRSQAGLRALQTARP